MEDIKFKNNINEIVKYQYLVVCEGHEGYLHEAAFRGLRDAMRYVLAAGRSSQLWVLSVDGEYKRLKNDF